jgi:hypothetical protein
MSCYVPFTNILRGGRILSIITERAENFYSCPTLHNRRSVPATFLGPGLFPMPLGTLACPSILEASLSLGPQRYLERSYKRSYWRPHRFFEDKSSASDSLLTCGGFRTRNQVLLQGGGVRKVRCR